LKKLLNRALVFSVLALLTIKTATAQIADESLPSITIGVGYFGELITHPGFVVFGEMALNKHQSQLAARLNLAHFRHRGHTRSFLLLPEFIFRRNTRSCNFWEASLGAGATYQRADSRALEYENGDFVERQSGWLYFTPSVGARFGRHIYLNNGRALSPSIGGKFFYQYPFNDFWLSRTAVDVSISYQLK